jgi:hypothetical protein
MKTVYEIAWDLLQETTTVYGATLTEKLIFNVDDVSRLTGLPQDIVILFKKKQEILQILPDKEDLTLVCQVIEEIQDGKPHYLLSQEQSLRS